MFVWLCCLINGLVAVSRLGGRWRATIIIITVIIIIIIIIRSNSGRKLSQVSHDQRNQHGAIRSTTTTTMTTNTTTAAIERTGSVVCRPVMISVWLLVVWSVNWLAFWRSTGQSGV